MAKTMKGSVPLPMLESCPRYHAGMITRLAERASQVCLGGFEAGDEILYLIGRIEGHSQMLLALDDRSDLERKLVDSCVDEISRMHVFREVADSDLCGLCQLTAGDPVHFDLGRVR